MSLISSCVRDIGDALDPDSLGLPVSIASPKSVYDSLSCRGPVCQDFARFPRRRLLEYSRWTRQAYRGADYNVARSRYRPRGKPDEGGSYRAARENEDEDDEEDENYDEEGRIDDEEADEERDNDNDDGNENEETVNEESGEVYDYG